MDTTLQRLIDLLVRDYRVDRERLTPDAPCKT
jgi:hypothetical protein